MFIDLLVNIGVPKQYAGDVLAAALFVLLSIILTVLVKKKNLGAMMISVYVAYAVLDKVFFDFLSNSTLKAILFLVLIMAVFSFIKRFIKMRISGGKIAIWAKISLAALSIVGMIASIVLAWLPDKFLAEFFTIFSAEMFLTKEAQFIWMIAPLSIILMLRKK